MNDLAALEAVLFVTEQPVPTRELAEVLELPVSRVEVLLEELAEKMTQRDAGLVLKSVAGGWRLYSHPDAYPYLERFASSATARKLSPAAMETLAVVAYRQPVSRGQISELRGVDSDSAVRTLERLGLVEEKERLNIPGNPAVYRTTDLFLERIGLNELGELPPLADHVPPAQFVDTLEESIRPRGGSLDD
ncbi:MAG TPA: SMC-Scp complex subunit ScpB [Acidimicrobiia bacterium]|nr:SMC-Scp complex subunit ScpB [Acidimicrobiia bacterium]